MDHIHTFSTTQGHGGPPRMSDQPYAGATSETAQTWKTIHTLSHPNKANMEWWLRRSNDIRGPWGPKISWHLSYRWGKTPKNTPPRKLVPTGDRTRARCVTSAHAATCSTAVDGFLYIFVISVNSAAKSFIILICKWVHIHHMWLVFILYNSHFVGMIS